VTTTGAVNVNGLLGGSVLHSSGSGNQHVDLAGIKAGETITIGTGHDRGHPGRWQR
jgi:hypothetical protein